MLSYTFQNINKFKTYYSFKRRIIIKKKKFLNHVPPPRYMWGLSIWQNYMSSPFSHPWRHNFPPLKLWTSYKTNPNTTLQNLGPNSDPYELETKFSIFGLHIRFLSRKRSFTLFSLSLYPRTSLYSLLITALQYTDNNCTYNSHTKTKKIN